MREEFNNFNENVPGKEGYSSTAQLIEYLKYYVDSKVAAKAEQEKRRKLYEAKKREILFWEEFLKGYKEAIQRVQRQIEIVKQRIKKLEEKEYKPKLSVNREKIRKAIRRGQAYLRELTLKLKVYQKKRDKLQKWVSGTIKETVWWKKGLAKEYPNMDRIIQDAIQDSQEGF
jgi:predicted RNase H-like nuclease (RuvC/YqgF family)